MHALQAVVALCLLSTVSAAASTNVTCNAEFVKKYACINKELNRAMGDVSSRDVDLMYECIHNELTACAQSTSTAGGLASILSLLGGNAAATSDNNQLPPVGDIMELVSETKQCTNQTMPRLMNRTESCMATRVSSIDLKPLRRQMAARELTYHLDILLTAKMVEQLSTKAECPKLFACAPNKKTFKNLARTVCTRTNICDRQVRTAKCKTLVTSIKEASCTCGEDIVAEIGKDNITATMVKCMDSKIPYTYGDKLRACTLLSNKENAYRDKQCVQDLTDPIDALCNDDQKEHPLLDIYDCLQEAAPVDGIGNLLSGGLSSIQDIQKLAALSQLTGALGGGLGNAGGLGSLATLAGGNSGGLAAFSNLAGGTGGLAGLSSLASGGSSLGAGGLGSILSSLGGRKK